MNLSSYLGGRLKDDSVLELLECHDLEVIYHFDRIHENTPDFYTSSCLEGGFELRFDENQILSTVFCYIDPRDGFSPIEASIVGVPLYGSLADAQTAASQFQVAITVRENVESLGRVFSWVRLEFSDHWRRYEYSSGSLSEVTLMLPWK